MNKYFAFLRGININCRNRIGTLELKSVFESAGFCDISTYLNSGNIAFSAEPENADKIIIEELIAQRFGLEIPVYIIPADELNDILLHAPDRWNTGDKGKYDNLIFILSSDSPEEIYELIGEPSAGLETVQIYKNVIFWTFDRQLYQKCSWWRKTASAGIAEKLTIRTANTINKLCCQKNWAAKARRPTGG